jgi:hypothetical protein
LAVSLAVICHRLGIGAAFNNCGGGYVGDVVGPPVLARIAETVTAASQRTQWL